MAILFNSKQGNVSSEQLEDSLRKVGASDCDVLYIHTDMTFGLPAVPRKPLLEKLYSCIENLGVRTVVFPTFTFSFCNNESYDVTNSPSRMGALNEFVRKNIQGVRTIDPMLSVYVVGDRLNLVDDLSRYSIGKNSNYDRLHTCGKKVKFLFLGADMRECFTYTHFMESYVKVPYRYDREFVGDIIDYEGHLHSDEKYWLFSTYGNCKLNPVPVVHNTMEKLGMLNKVPYGDGQICCFSEKDAFSTMQKLFSDDIYFLTDGSFKESEKNTVYTPKNERVVSVK